jgi:hypothetical protein
VLLACFNRNLLEIVDASKSIEKGSIRECPAYWERPTFSFNAKSKEDQISLWVANVEEEFHDRGVVIDDQVSLHFENLL